ncbi:NDE1, mitochondrial external NADH dehydrogenase [Chiua virens]|nr:NDE1, mitochondrial external NADH dehydrogenase [Chiua virens]
MSLLRHTVRSTYYHPARVASNARIFSSSALRSKQRLVVLGSGWGGYEVLRGVDKKRWDVTIVSPTNAFNFTPLLASCAVGTLEFRCAVESVSISVFRIRIRTVDTAIFPCQMPATHLPSEKSSAPPVQGTQSETQFPGTGTPFTVRYDKLVIAVGAYTQSKSFIFTLWPRLILTTAFNVPGVKDYAHFLKDVRDARAIRTRILDWLLKRARRVIPGGGPTGVEFAAELHDLLHTEIERHYPSLARLTRITLYDVAPSILGSFDRSLSIWAEEKFRRDGISLKTRHHVERVEKVKMVLYIYRCSAVPFGLLVWSTGLAPNPLIQSIDYIEKHERSQRYGCQVMSPACSRLTSYAGSLLTNEHLNVITKDGRIDPDVWAIGDAAIIKTAVLPATAQVANQKAKYMVNKLNSIVKEREHTKPFKFHDLGSLAYLGDWKAIYDRSTAETGFKAKESGRLAWLLWRSAYFTMTLSIRNKILVPTYWFLNCAYLHLFAMRGVIVT